MMTESNKPASAQRPCPICGTPAEPAYRPFCSKRCRDKDLGNWAAEAYAVPAVEADIDWPDAEPEA